MQVTIGWWIIPALVTLLAGPVDWLLHEMSGEYDETRPWQRCTVILASWLVYAIVA